MKKIGVAAAGLALVAAVATGCGGSGGGASGSDAPKDASKTDFCKGLAQISSDSSSDSDKDPKAAVKKAKDEAKKLQSIGTPSGIPSSARKGFEELIDAINKIPDDASSKDLASLGNKFSKSEQADFTAFAEYAGKECPGSFSG